MGCWHSGFAHTLLHKTCGCVLQPNGPSAVCPAWVAAGGHVRRVPLHGRPAVFARSAEALQLTQVSRRGGTDTFSAVAVAAARKPTTCAVNGGAWAPWSVGSGARTGPRSWGVVFFVCCCLARPAARPAGLCGRCQARGPCPTAFQSTKCWPPARASAPLRSVCAGGPGGGARGCGTHTPFR